MFAFLTDSDSLWLTLALSGSISRSLCHSDSCSLWLTLTHSGSLSSSPRRSLTHKVLARLSTSEMHSPSSSRPVPPLTLLIPLILFNYTALAAYTAYSMIPLILLRLLGHRRCWTKQKQGSIIGTEFPYPVPLPPSLIYRWRKIVSKYFPTDCCVESGRCKRWYIIAKRLTYCYSCRVIWGKWDHSSRSNNNTCGNIFGWKRKWKFRIFIQQLYAHKR